MKPNEGYPKDWLRVVLMVSPTGELHAIGGDHPVGYGEDAPYAGLERIKRFWKHFGDDGNEVTPVALGEAFQKSLPSPATSRDCETLARLKENLPAPYSYEATLQTIKDAPLTWLGGILACVVEESMRRKFFKDADWLMYFVRRVTEEKKP